MNKVFKPKLLSSSNWRYIFKLSWVTIILLLFIGSGSEYLVKNGFDLSRVIFVTLSSLALILFIISVFQDQKEFLVIDGSRLLLNQRMFFTNKSRIVDLKDVVKIDFDQIESVNKPLIPFQIEYYFEFISPINKDTPEIYREKKEIISLYQWDTGTVTQLVKFIREYFKNIEWI